MKKKCVGVVRSAQELALDVFDLWIETEIAKDANPLKAFTDCRYFMTIAFVALFAINILINFASKTY